MRSNGGICTYLFVPVGVVVEESLDRVGNNAEKELKDKDNDHNFVDLLPDVRLPTLRHAL